MRTATSTFPALVLLLGATATAQPPADSTRLVTAARARQDSIKTAAITFKATATISPGAISGSTGNNSEQRAQVPAREMRLEWTNRLILDGEMVRFEDNEPIINANYGSLVPVEWVFAFDGSKARSFYPHGSGGSSRPTALIVPEGQLEFQSSRVRPLTLFFRGLSSLLNPHPLSAWKPDGSTRRIDGALCQGYVWPIHGGLTGPFLGG